MTFCHFLSLIQPRTNAILPQNIEILLNFSATNSKKKTTKNGYECEQMLGEDFKRSYKVDDDAIKHIFIKIALHD